MKKLGVLVCTNSAIDYIDHDYQVDIVRSLVILGNKEYVDYEELTAEQFYKTLKDDPSIFPRTSMASTGKMLEHYEKLRDEGCDTILFITISSKMSGTYENALLAAKMVEGVDIYVFDSKSVGYVECKMVFTAHESFKAGKTIEEIIADLEYIRDNNKIYFAVNDLSYLVKNGRLSNAAAFFAKALKIKPLLTINDEGAVVSAEKIRTFKKALDRVIEKYMEETEGKDVETFIIHAFNPEALKYVKETIAGLKPEIKEIKDYLLTPAVGAHAGPGAICVGYIVNKK